jgi:hypothetical protein
MARVNFSALISSITGKLAGSVFQDSYGGFQIRTRVSPRNPQTYYQQLRRGEFGYITQLWRGLTQPERDTWIAGAPSGMSGINFFVQCNVNLTLIEQSLISSFVGGTTPSAFPMTIAALGGGIFTIQASGAVTTVPAGLSVLVFATYEKAPSKIFTNPSQYTPVITYPPATDLSAPVSISAEWINRYGQFTSDQRICIKSVAIEHVSGFRSADTVYCAIETAPETYFVIDDAGNILENEVGDQIIYQ